MAVTGNGGIRVRFRRGSLRNGLSDATDDALHESNERPIARKGGSRGEMSGYTSLLVFVWAG